MTQYKPVDRRAWARLRWGLPAAALLALLLPLLPLTVRAACPGPPLKLLPLGPGVWQVPGWPGEADARNRGWVSNLLLVRQSPAGPDRLDAPDMPDTPDMPNTPDMPDGADKPDRPRRPPGPHPAPRLWALGSGPSPAWGAALACQVRQRLGGCRALGRARVDPEMGLSLGAKRSHTVWYGEHLQRRISPISGSTRRAGEILGAMLRCQLVVWRSHTPHRRLDWHRNSPRRGPDPKPDSLLGANARSAARHTFERAHRQRGRWRHEHRAGGGAAAVVFTVDRSPDQQSLFCINAFVRSAAYAL